LVDWSIGRFVDWPVDISAAPPPGTAALQARLQAAQPYGPVFKIPLLSHLSDATTRHPRRGGKK